MVYTVMARKGNEVNYRTVIAKTRAEAIRKGMLKLAIAAPGFKGVKEINKMENTKRTLL